ncbi:MAG: ribonuclease HII [Chloroflexi bacterium]|nr:ribonuclease HII [Chloroflexota bacterium]
MASHWRPSFAEEKGLAKQGYRLIAGIDEVGRGALAGPVAAAAVILPLRIKAPWLKQVRDSKLLSPEKREVLSQNIRGIAISVGVGTVSHEIIDRRGIVKATYLAMILAIKQLSPPAETLLIDYFRLPGTELPQKGVRDGDTLCFSIACASIVAKVARDRLMTELDSAYPGYGLANHKGYGTEEHLACLQRFGPCPIHRRSFSPVREMVEG